MRLQRVNGFTLIELMIVVAIIGITVAFAFPAYQDNVKKTRRNDAQGALMAFSSAMERHFVQNNTFLGAAGTKTVPANTGSPWIFASEAPIDGSDKYYDLTIAAATATTYTLRAVPKGTMVGNGRLQLDSVGNRTWNSKDDGSGTDKTW